MLWQNLRERHVYLSRDQNHLRKTTCYFRKLERNCPEGSKTLHDMNGSCNDDSLHVCMHLCMYICILYVYMHIIYPYTHMYAYVHIIYIHIIYIYMHVYVCISCMYTYIYTVIYANRRICICERVCVCVCAPQKNCQNI